MLCRKWKARTVKYTMTVNFDKLIPLIYVWTRRQSHLTTIHVDVVELFFWRKIDMSLDPLPYFSWPKWLRKSGSASTWRKYSHLSHHVPPTRYVYKPLILPHPAIRLQLRGGYAASASASASALSLLISQKEKTSRECRSQMQRFLKRALSARLYKPLFSTNLWTYAFVNLTWKR